MAKLTPEPTGAAANWVALPTLRGACDLDVPHLCPRSLLGDDAAENLITLCNESHQMVHLQLS